MRGVDGTSRETTRPAGVANSLQVTADDIPPAEGNRILNLLTKDDDRALLADEPEPRRPKIARIESTR